MILAKAVGKFFLFMPNRMFGGLAINVTVTLIFTMLTYTVVLFSFTNVFVCQLCISDVSVSYVLFFRSFLLGLVTSGQKAIFTRNKGSCNSSVVRHDIRPKPL